MLNSESISRDLPVGRFGRSFEFHSTIGTTNDRAAELAAGGAQEGALIVAAEQTRGKGRAGRSWDTPAGGGLGLSVVLRPPADHYRGLGLIGGLAVVSALEAYQLEPLIKWPNDVLLAGRKLCGVLAEASWSGEELEHVVLGIGVNLRLAAKDRMSAYDFPATALAEHLPSLPDPNQLVLRVLEGLERWYARYLDGAAHPEWERWLAYRSQAVNLAGDLPTEAPGTPVKLMGLTVDGGLRVQRQNGSELIVNSGGVTLRPAESGLA